MAQRTQLQIIVQALTALSYEVRAMTMAVRAPDFVCSKMHEIQADANRLMQSAQADADLLAFLEQTQEAGVQVQIVWPVESDELVEPIEPGSTTYKRDPGD